MANGYSATGYGLAIRDEKDKSSMESVNVGFQFVLKLYPQCTYAAKKDMRIIFRAW